MAKHSKGSSFWEVLSVGLTVAWFVIVVSITPVPIFVHSLLIFAIFSFLLFFRPWAGDNQ